MYPQTNATPFHPVLPSDPPSDDRTLAVATLEVIRSARQRVETAGMRACNIADRVFGSQPQAATGGVNKVSEPSCAKAALELELRELHNAIEWLDQQVNRLDRIA